MHISPIRKLTKKDLLVLTKKYGTQSEILNELGLRAAGRNFKSLRVKLLKYNLYTSFRIKTNKKRVQRMHALHKIPLNKKLVRNSTYDNRGNLKRELIKKKLLKNKCAICGMPPIWNNKKLVLILDHINGIHNDHRLKNLRLLCPNCNSQTDTFCGRNK